MRLPELLCPRDGRLEVPRAKRRVGIVACAYRLRLCDTKLAIARGRVAVARVSLSDAVLGWPSEPDERDQGGAGNARGEVARVLLPEGLHRASYFGEHDAQWTIDDVERLRVVVRRREEDAQESLELARAGWACGAPLQRQTEATKTATGKAVQEQCKGCHGR